MLANPISLVDQVRFWRKVRIPSGDACWRWQGGRYTNGYGQVQLRGKKLRAHRVAWEWERGPVPPTMCVLHRCDEPLCVNPAHLFLGTNADNSADMTAKHRSNRGQKNGHAKLSEDDVIDVRTIRAIGGTLVNIATAYGLTRQAVRAICNGKTWAHVPGGLVP